VIAVTPKGARPLSPDVGVVDPTFTDGVDPAQLTADLEDAHPLALVSVQVDGPDTYGQQTVTVNVDLAE
jgi:hypothetical protein